MQPTPPWVLDRPLWTPFLSPHQMRLPGLNVLPDHEWIADGPDLPAQMAERARLLREQRVDVVAMRPDEGEEPAIELLDHLTKHLEARSEWDLNGSTVRRPDGISTSIDSMDP